MKNTITILLLFICINSFAQRDRKQIRQAIEAQKTAFITKQLDLSVTEAEKFWPIFNAFEAKINTIKAEQIRPLKKQMFSDTTISEKNANKLLQQLIDAENKMHDAKLALVKDLRTVIPALKILKLKAAEDRFNRRLLERLKKLKESRRKNR